MEGEISRPLRFALARAATRYPLGYRRGQMFETSRAHHKRSTSAVASEQLHPLNPVNNEVGIAGNDVPPEKRVLWSRLNVERMRRLG